MSLDITPLKQHRSPNGEGLVTNIYPKIAAMMALDGARSKIEQRQQEQRGDQAGQEQDSPRQSVSPDEEDQIRQDAVRRAARFESCTLSWDHDSGRYYLFHPGLDKGKGKRFVMVIDQGLVGFDVVGARGTIRLMEAPSPPVLALDVGGREHLEKGHHHPRRQQPRRRWRELSPKRF